MNATNSNKPNTIQGSQANSPFYQSMIFRVFALIILLALTLIPISSLQNILNGQRLKEQNIVEDMSQVWGNKQTIIGPVLSIPYVERISRIESQTDSNGVKSSVSRDIFNNKTLMLLPENLNILADLKDKLLSQDNSETHVYQGEIELNGNFNLEALPEASGYNTIEWDKAFVTIGLSDNTSVNASTPLRWEGSSARFNPGTQLPQLLNRGIHAKLGEVASDKTSPSFKILLNLKGVENLQFAPMGQLTTINITSNWANTNVSGDIPASSKVTSTEGFEATWRVSSLARNYPQQWLVEEDHKEVIDFDFKSLLTGVEFEPNRTSKSNYLTKVKIIVDNLIIILGITYLSLLILEFKRNSRSKPKFIQYLVVSLPILLTPVMLLALNHIMSFVQAYQTVAITSIILIVLFVSSITRSLTAGFYLLLIVASLYAAQFINIEMKDFALVASSTAGTFITVILMWAAYNIQEDK